MMKKRFLWAILAMNLHNSWNQLNKISKLKLLFSCIIVLGLVSCQSKGSNKSLELQRRIDSIANELNSIKRQKITDSSDLKSQWANLRDSLKLITVTTKRDLSELYESLKSSVFLVYTSSENNLFQGSAFLINSDGTCISNYHVFDGTNKGMVENERGEKFPIIKILNYDTQKDYIIFQISMPNEFVTPLKLSTVGPKVGDECFAIGNPRGLSQTLSTGIISGFRENGNLLQTTAEITHGSSGGALFNKKGEVIGITTSGLGEADINFAVNINVVNYLPALTIPNTASYSTFLVTIDQAFFHNQPNSESIRNAYLIRDNTGAVLNIQNGYAYVVFQNQRGQTTRGWINLNELSTTTLGQASSVQNDISSAQKQYVIISEKATFYTMPNLNLPRKAYLLKGDVFSSDKSENGFAFTVVTNPSGKKTAGWINMMDIQKQ